MISSLFYNIKQAFVQIFRNRGMSAASIFSILAMLLILGLVFIIVVNINLFFIVDGTSEQQVQEVKAQIEAQPGVTSVEYRSQEDALKIMKERWGESGYLLDSLGDNPLPASLMISVESLDDAGSVASYAGKFDIIEDVQYYKDTVEKLTRITHFLQIAGMIIMAFLVIVSVVVVSNTIKLTVMARADEIHIMKYVGANNWFIRGPFMVEGIIIGLIASLIAGGAIALIYKQIVAAVGDQVFAIVSSPLISVQYMTVNLLIIFVALGCSIGAWGSIVSMRRYLKA